MKLDNIRKIFVLGDLHLGVRNNSIEWSDIQSDYLINHFIRAVHDDGFDPDRDILIQVGDWNHVRESTNVRIQHISYLVAKTFSEMFKRGVYFFVGNHDVYYKDRTDVHSLKGYDLMYPNFHIFEKPELLTINSHKVLILPWIEDSKELKRAALANRSADYVFCHADIQGFNLNSVTKIEHGLAFEDLKDFKRIYSGHIHIRQEKGNVLYVGTPYEMDRGDRGNLKGFYVLDATGSNFSEKFIPNQVSPRHLKFDISTVLNMNPTEISEAFCNNYVDLFIESSFSSVFPLARFTEIVKDAGHRRLEFFSYSKELNKEKSTVELDSNYEYNIFNVLDDQVASLNLPEYKTAELKSRFKSIYDSLKNTKRYD